MYNCLSCRTTKRGCSWCIFQARTLLKLKFTKSTHTVLERKRKINLFENKDGRFGELDLQRDLKGSYLQGAKCEGRSRHGHGLSATVGGRCSPHSLTNSRHWLIGGQANLCNTQHLPVGHAHRSGDGKCVLHGDGGHWTTQD